MTDERIAAIERTLTEAKELGDAERQLLMVWLEETDKPLAFEYEGGFVFDRVGMKLSPGNEIVGFWFDIDYDPCRECGERSGEYRLNLFGFDFWHYGVTGSNEDAWYDAEWGEDAELEQALNEHLAGDFPTIEKYLSWVELTEGYIKDAFKIYSQECGDAKLVFFTDRKKKVYVYAIDMNHFCVTPEMVHRLDEIRIGRSRLRDALQEDHNLWEHENSNGELVDYSWRTYGDVVRSLCECPVRLPEINDIRDRPLDFVLISEEEAIRLLLELNLPFEVA